MRVGGARRGGQAEEPRRPCRPPLPGNGQPWPASRAPFNNSAPLGGGGDGGGEPPPPPPRLKNIGPNFLPDLRPTKIFSGAFGAK